MGVGFDEYLVFVVEGVVDGVFELYWLVDVLVLVFGVYIGGIYEFVGDSGEECYCGSMGFDIL